MEDDSADQDHGRVTVNKHSAAILADHRRFSTVSVLIPSGVLLADHPLRFR